MEYARLGDYVNIRTGRLDANAAVPNGQYPFFTCSKEISTIDTYSFDTECVLVAGNGDLNVKYYKGKFDAYQRTYVIENKENSIFYIKYIYYFMERYILELKKQTVGGIIKFIKLGNLTDAKIPVLSMEKQLELIQFFDKFNKTIEDKQYEMDILNDLVKSQFIEMFGDINNCHFKYPLDNFGKKVIFDTKMTTDFSKYGNLIYVGVENIEKNSGNLVNLTYVKDNELKSGKYLFNEQHIIYSKIRPNLNKVALPTFEGLTSADSYPILVNDDMNKYYVTYVLRSFNYLQYADKVSRRANMPKINKEQMSNYMIMVPPKTLQDQFAAIVEQIDKSKYFGGLSYGIC